MHNNIVCLYALLYFLVNTVNSEFVDCIDNSENVLHSCDFNHIIITVLILVFLGIMHNQNVYQNF